MSQQQKQRVTEAAIRQWQEEQPTECYSAWLAVQLAAGRYWGAKEIL